MFGRRLIPLGAALLALLLVPLGVARPPGGAAPEASYIVRPGDTLWEIAAERYGGDPREGVWRIRDRNGLDAGALVPGQVLALP
jgi:nucleoid-associated protein YgaU